MPCGCARMRELSWLRPSYSMIPKSLSPTPVGDGYRFPACAKPLHSLTLWTDPSAGVGRSDKITLR
jgi:hypothetical protein